jgi:hypothetical protein
LRGKDEKRLTQGWFVRHQYEKEVYGPRPKAEDSRSIALWWADGDKDREFPPYFVAVTTGFVGRVLARGLKRCPPRSISPCGGFRSQRPRRLPEKNETRISQSIQIVRVQA